MVEFLKSEIQQAKRIPVLFKGFKGSSTEIDAFLYLFVVEF